MAAPRPRAVVDSTTAFASLDAKIDGIKDDLLRELGGQIERLTTAVENQTNAAVRRDVLTAELAKRDLRLDTLEEARQIQDERAAAQRTGLIVTAVSSGLALATGALLAMIRLPN